MANKVIQTISRLQGRDRQLRGDVINHVSPYCPSWTRLTNSAERRSRKDATSDDGEDAFANSEVCVRLLGHRDDCVLWGDDSGSIERQTPSEVILNVGKLF